MLNVFEPSMGWEEEQAVSEVLTSHWIGKGQKVAEFERAWADHIGVDPAHVVSITSCTEGLFQAVELLNLGSSDEVIIPSIHFIGAANAVIKAEATPVFCDVSHRTLNTQAGVIAWAKTPRTKAVILNHYGGMSDFDYDFFKAYPDIKLIEDCACNPLATPRGDIAVWSFDAMKIMSTGDGGMVYCRDPEFIDRLRKNTYLGQDSQSGLSSNSSRWWEFGVTMPGRRAIMNDIAAAIGLEQLKKLPGFIARRKQIWEMYNERLDGLDWLTLPPPVPDYVQSSYYFYWVQLGRRDELAAYLKERQIYTTFRYYPLHQVFKTGQNLPGADRAADTTLLLPLHQGLRDNEVDYVCEMVQGFQ